MGALPANEVSDWMRKSLAGFVSYPSHCLGKSGIFAAYAAHGLVPVLPRRCVGSDRDGLMPGKHFAIAEDLGLEAMSRVQILSEAACDWYQGHRVDAQAEQFYNCLSGTSESKKPAL